MPDFGIGELITALATSAGVGAETAGIIGTVGAGALEGAGIGAAGGAITGGDPGLGALTGGITGGLIPGAGAVGADLGISPVLSEAIGGAAGGAIGAGITGGNPLTSTITGGAAGALSGALSGAGPGAGAAPGTGGITGGAGTSAAGIAAPTGAGAIGGGGDVTIPTIPTTASAGSILAPDATNSILNPANTLGSSTLSLPSTSAGSAATSVSGSSIDAAIANPSFSTVTKALGNNASWLVPAAGVAFSALKGDQTPPGLDQLNQIASSLKSQGADLSSYLNSGTLPAGISAQLGQAGDAAKASIRSAYASRGMSGSSAEARDLANVEQTVTAKGAEIAISLLQSGIQESQVAGNLYEAILRESLAQDQNLASAIGSFAGAAAGSGFGTRSAAPATG